MGKFCPFIKEDCSADCVLYRAGLRYSEDPKIKPTPFAECTFNIIADCMEQMVMRSIGTQAGMDKVANQLLNLGDLAKRKALR